MIKKNPKEAIVKNSAKKCRIDGKNWKWSMKLPNAFNGWMPISRNRKRSATKTNKEIAILICLKFRCVTISLFEN